MGKFTVGSKEEESELRAAVRTDSSYYTTPMALPGSDGQSRVTYHNPVTGREITNPSDPYLIQRRLRQGWKLGSASPELKEKWKVREAELLAEDDAYVKAHIASTEHVESEKARFNEAVAAAVTQVLEKLESNTAPTELSGKAGVAETAPAPDPDQLNFFASVDAPPESETKHVVSQASQLGLHLVDLGDN